MPKLKTKHVISTLSLLPQPKFNSTASAVVRSVSRIDASLCAELAHIFYLN
jgi:hypothetical protein